MQRRTSTFRATKNTERLEAPDADAASVTELHIVVTAGASAGAEVPCGTRAVHIGAAAENDLVLADRGVSRRHAVLESAEGRLVVRDLGSTNGTFVDELRVREAFLKPGNVLRIGDATLRLELLSRQQEIPTSAASSFGHLVGHSARMRQLFTVLTWVAPTQTSVLITGPTGSGKEMVARSLHEASDRAKHPLVVFDCGATDPALISSELFGHEAGAFTGAAGRRAGVFEQAQGGTVFLDEIGELPLDLQPKLLRVLDNRELRRLGGNKTIALDVRVLSATNRPLDQMVTQGRFREDLLYRLCQVHVALPPLDERREDLPLLVERLLERLPGPKRSFTSAALDLLARAPLPGNVRQLRNIVERAALVSRVGPIGVEHLTLDAGELGGLRRAATVAPEAPAGPATPAMPSTPVSVPGYDPDGDAKRRIIEALNAHDHNLTRAAEVLGMAFNTLKARMRRLGIPFATRYTRRDQGP